MRWKDRYSQLIVNSKEVEFVRSLGLLLAGKTLVMRVPFN